MEKQGMKFVFSDIFQNSVQGDCEGFFAMV